jgi:hypothetical protein
MENHHFSWENPLLMAIFNSYVELPEGIRTRCHVFYSVTCEKTEIVSICFYMKWLDVWFHPKEKCKNYKYPSIPTNGGGMAVKMVLNTMKWWLKGAYTLITLQKWSQVIKNKEIVFSGFQGPQDVFNWKRTWKKTAAWVGSRWSAWGPLRPCASLQTTSQASLPADTAFV